MQQVYCEPGQNRKIAALSMNLCAHFLLEKNMIEKIIDKIKKMNKIARMQSIKDNKIIEHG